MAAPTVIPAPAAVLGRPEPPSAAYLASQVWTAERVRRELIRDDRPWPRYEFIDGELLVSHDVGEGAVSPGPQRRHQRAVRVLALLLGPYVERHRLGEVLFAPLDVQVGPDATVQPDVLVAPPDGPDGMVSDAPVTRLTLAAEVLSPSTARQDRVRKRALFAGHEVPEYWVVDCDARLFEVSRPSDPRVELYARELRWHPSGAPEPLVIDVIAYFERVVGQHR